MSRPPRRSRHDPGGLDRGDPDRRSAPSERPRDRFNDRHRDDAPRDGRSHRSPRRSPARYDTYRSGDGRRSRSPRRHSPPRGPRRDNYRDGRQDDFGRGDSYRPPQSDFTFRMDKPAGMPEIPFHPGRQGLSRRGRGKDGPGRRGNRGGRRFAPVHPSERALIAGGVSLKGEERLGNGLGGSRFRNLDELSDDEEQEMDESDRNSASSDFEKGRSNKRTKIGEDDQEAQAAPKWSNPDPYTALPPPDEQNGKKRDVVALIRKARLEEKAPQAPSTKEAEDFISFDLTDDEKEGNPNQDDGNSESSYNPAPAITPPPPPPPNLRRLSEHSLPPRPPSYLDHIPGTSQPPVPIGPPPGLAVPINGDVSNPPTAPASRRPPEGPLGSRKRTADDEIKPPDYGQAKKATKKAPSGMLVSAWEAKTGEDPCPWGVMDHSSTKNVAFRLHKEIIDFYEYVRPRKFEQKIRDTLVSNLAMAMRRDARNFSSARVMPFGSFMSGLYLPTADMDLVVCSIEFTRNNYPKFLTVKSWLFKFKTLLVSQRIADADTVEVISKARVPLVKYVDKTTGLRVDVSFDNLGGVNAVQTFLDWKALYPSMPILVTVIKQFLLMRGLNEPVNGGIGGFSVICLVVSMLQQMPQVQSRSMIPEHHLGEMLLEFFDLYGHHFNYQANAISLTRHVGYIPKNHVRGFTYKNRDRISIIDPNNEQNDVSGGSSNSAVIVRRFAEAYDSLRKRMAEVAKNPGPGRILDVLMEGDYSSFRKQRTFIKHVHEKTIGPCAD